MSGGRQTRAPAPCSASLAFRSAAEAAEAEAASSATTAEIRQVCAKILVARFARVVRTRGRLCF